MNLERLLAENMIRFNTKNLNENQIRKLLKEQVAIDTNQKGTGMLAKFVASPDEWGPNFTANLNSVKTLLTRNKIKFTYVDTATAAVWLTIAGYKYQRGKYAELNALTVSAFSKACEGNTSVDTSDWDFEWVVQCMQSPDDPTKILTAGVITATGASGTNEGESSSLADVVQYLNDYNMGETIKGLCANKAGALIEVTQESVESGDPNTTPGAGSLYVTNVVGTYYSLCYSQTAFQAASAGTAVQTSTETVWTPGPETKADLPKNLFPVLSVKLDAAQAPAIAKAIEDAKKLGQITSVRIESGASFDEPVKLDNAGFAAKLGLQPNQVPADPTKDAEGVVKDPMSGGNAFLAYQRAQAMLNAIGNTAGVTPTVVATVAKGGDAARYARLVFGIKKPDQSTTTTKDDIANIGMKSASTDLSGKIQMLGFSMG
jgi:hypothetical protein